MISFCKNDSESNYSSSKNLISALAKKQERKINCFFGIDKATASIFWDWANFSNSK